MYFIACDRCKKIEPVDETYVSAGGAVAPWSKTEHIRSYSIHNKEVHLCDSCAEGLWNYISGEGFKKIKKPKVDKE